MNTNPYSEFDETLWRPRLDFLLSNTIAHTCTNQNYEGEIRNQGDKVKLPDNQNLTIDQKKFFACKVNDVEQVQSNTDIMDAHLMNARKAITEVEETYLLSQHNTVDTENIIGSEFEPIELEKRNIYQHFVKLALCLKNNNVDFNKKRPWVIINPWIESYLLQSTEFIGARNIADETIRQDAIGRIASMDVLVSTNLTAVDGKFYVLAGTNEAITFASQLAKIESLRDKDSFSDLVRGLYLYDAKTVQPKALAKMVVKL